MNKYGTTLLLLLLFTTNSLFGQKNYRTKIKSMFDKTSNGLWIKSYQGTFDNSFPISMYMGISEDQCRAIIQYDQDKKVFSLEGSIVNDQYILHEYDSNGLQTGTIQFQLSNNHIIGEWVGINGLKKYPIDLTKKKPKSVINNHVSPYIYNFYSNLNNDIRINISQQLNNIKVKISIGEAINEWIFYDQHLEDKEWSLSNEMITYKIVPLGDNKLLLRVDYPDKQENHHLNLNQNLNFRSEIKLTYNTKAEVHFPHLQEEKFNVWMKKMIQKTWESQLEVLTVDHSNSNYSPYDRYNNELFIYTDVQSYTANVISGLIYVQNKNLNQIQTIPFSYNLDKKKPIEISKLFKKEKKEVIFRQYAALAYQKATELPEGLEKEWLLSCPYDYAILTDDAIELYTPFNMIFGNSSIRIPFIEIHDSIKNLPN